MNKTNNYLKKLMKEGYVIIDNFLSEKKCNFYIKKIEKLLKMIKETNDKLSHSTKEGQVILRDLVLRDPKTFLKIIDDKKILELLTMIYKETFILSNIMASNSVNVGKKYSRSVHIDSHIASWRRWVDTTDVVAMICLDKFTKFNGATKVWPKSHLYGIKIHHQKKYLKRHYKNFKYLEAKKGSLVIFLGQMWHQVGHNSSSERRWAILNHYTRWWIKPATDFTKCGKKIYKMLNNNQKRIFGFSSIAPKFNFKKQSKPLYTLRNINKISKNYKQATNY